MSNEHEQSEVREEPATEGASTPAAASAPEDSKPALPVSFQVGGSGGSIHLPEHSARILLNLVQGITIKDGGMKMQIGIAQMDLEKGLAALEEAQPQTKDEKRAEGADKAAAAAAARQARNGNS